MNTPNNHETPSETHYKFADALDSGLIKLKEFKAPKEVETAQWSDWEESAEENPKQFDTEGVRLVTCTLATADTDKTPKEEVHVLVDIHKQKVVLVLRGTPPQHEKKEDLVGVATQIRQRLSKDLTFYI